MAKQFYRRYNYSTETYNESQDVPRVRYCNGFTVTNIGDTTFKVNGKIFFPSATPLTSQGDSMSFGGNEGEIYIDKITLSFLTPLNTAPLAEIVQKFYINEDETT